MHKHIEFSVRGIAPLLMHNGRLVNPLDPIVTEMKKLTAKRTNKTDADHEELARLEWMGGLYLDDNGAPAIPGEVIEAMLIQSAKAVRKGPQAKAGIISDGVFPLNFDGPKDVDKLWRDTRFRDQRGVRVTSSRIIRTRPRFDDWRLKFTVSYLPTVLNEQTVKDWLIYAGRMVGMGDYRPRFGRFEVE